MRNMGGLRACLSGSRPWSDPLGPAPILLSQIPVFQGYRAIALRMPVSTFVCLASLVRLGKRHTGAK